MLHRGTARILLAMALLSPAANAAEGDGAPYRFSIATYAHYRSSSDHAGLPVLAALELRRPRDRFIGAALFENSFGQFSQFVYYGWTFPLPWIHEGVRLKLPVGLIHGYRGDHQDDIPLNQLGVAPAILPALGYQHGRWGGNVVILGTAGLLFSIDYAFGD